MRERVQVEIQIEIPGIMSHLFVHPIRQRQRLRLVCEFDLRQHQAVVCAGKDIHFPDHPGFFDPVADLFHRRTIAKGRDDLFGVLERDLVVIFIPGDSLRGALDGEESLAARRSDPDRPILLPRKIALAIGLFIQRPGPPLVAGYQKLSFDFQSHTRFSPDASPFVKLKKFCYVQAPMTSEHFIHLCQPGAGKSCGACCGLYNYADSTRESLTERLRSRTGLFRRSVRQPADLAAFSREIRRAEDGAKLYEVIYCCEYLGFLDEEERRVGCLLHPRQNNGTDLRGVSFYGRELCDGHFCPSYHYISREEKLALLHILDDWYLYGLCVTDIDLVKEYFRFISEGAGGMPTPACFRDPALRESARRFFAFKVSWPYRSEATNRFGKYYFDGSQYMIHRIDYESLGTGKSVFDRIFLSLSSEFRSGGDVKKAEALVRKAIDEFVALYRELGDSR